MPQEVQTALMAGGLDLASPPIAIPPGKVIAASNYEPDVAGYTSFGGYERFDGHPRPSDSDDPTEIATRRASINAVPGTGPVRGVWVYDGSVYAFRDQDDGTAGMFRSGVGGWTELTFGSVIGFVDGVTEFVEDTYIVGGSSAASALVKRVVLRSGAWDGTAEGYIVVSNITGTFTVEETIEGGGGEAEVSVAATVIGIAAGGKFDFTNHNFYGAAETPSMYFANGTGPAFEWNSGVLTPIYTGTTAAGTFGLGVVYLLGRLVQTATMTIASPCVVTVTGHGRIVDEPIIFVTTGALPTGITAASTTYYVIATGLTVNTFQFSATLGGAAVNTSGSQSGTHSIASTGYADFIYSADRTGDGGSAAVPIVMSGSADADAPTFITHFKNHLWLGYSSGTLLNSSLGEPLEYISTSDAGEMSFGEPITGLLTAAATSLMVFGQNRIDYMTGNDATDFMLQPISETSGAQPYTAQMMDSPMFLDDGGVRSMPTTAAFGDWTIGTATQPVERLISRKRDAGIDAVASMKVKAKGQYRLFWEEGDGTTTGITVYIGRKYPETLPFRLPIEIFCACSGEVDNGRGDRLFVGCQDGYVYELNRGTSFDGEDIPTYIRLPFTSAKSPSQHTRWMKATFEIDTPDDIDVGVAFHVDYARGLGGALTSVDVDAGTAIVSTDAYAGIDWTQPVEGRLEHHIAGIGPNIAATLVTESATARQHTISSQTYNFSRRGLKR